MNIKRTILSCTLLIPFMFAGTVDAALVAAYNFDDDTATDVSGGGNDGTLGATTAFSTDNPFGAGGGKSAVFDGTGNAVITVATSPALEAVDNALTLAFWMKGNLGANWARQTEKRSGDGWSINRFNAENAVNLRVDTDADPGGFNQNMTASGTKILNVYDNTWHHIAFTMDNGTFVAYKDGVQVGTTTYNHGNGFGNNAIMYVGGRAGNSDNIMMDDFGIWDEALDANAIAALFNGPIINPIPEPSTLALLVMGIIACGVRGFSRRWKRA